MEFDSLKYGPKNTEAPIAKELQHWSAAVSKYSAHALMALAFTTGTIPESFACPWAIAKAKGNPVHASHEKKKSKQTSPVAKDNPDDEPFTSSIDVIFTIPEVDRQIELAKKQREEISKAAMIPSPDRPIAIDKERFDNFGWGSADKEAAVKDHVKSKVAPSPSKYS